MAIVYGVIGHDALLGVVVKQQKERRLGEQRWQGERWRDNVAVGEKETGEGEYLCASFTLSSRPRQASSPNKSVAFQRRKEQYNILDSNTIKRVQRIYTSSPVLLFLYRPRSEWINYRVCMNTFRGVRMYNSTLST